MLAYQNDTIAALATPPGRGGIAIVRVSGENARAYFETLFRPAGRQQVESHRLLYGHLYDADGAMLDECMAVLMLAPRTYTREDVAEFHLHGGDQIAREALAALHPRIVVKLPCTAAGIRAVKYFAAKNIRTNCTLVFSVGQALLAAKAGATYVSPFVGRLDDISEDGVALVAHIVKVYRTYGYKTQVLAASIRHTQHIIQCLDAGADVATCPLAAIEGLLRHPLTDSGLEKFLADHARLNA